MFMLGVSARRLLLAWILCPWRIANNNSDADVRPRPPHTARRRPTTTTRRQSTRLYYSSCRRHTITMADEKKIDTAAAVEEVQKAKAEIAEEVADEEVDASGEEFEVTKEEMSIIRAELACEFPDDYSYLR